MADNNSVTLMITLNVNGLIYQLRESDYQMNKKKT